MFCAAEPRAAGAARFARGSALTYIVTALGALAAAIVLALVSAPALAGPAAAVPPATAAGVAASPGGLLAAARSLRHTPGQEPLGIAYVAAYLRAAGAQRVDAEPFDALGTMAERLARRASMAGSGSEADAARLDAVAALGVHFVSFEREGRRQTCYDGQAFRRVLALQPEPEQQARAMLALTRHDCVDPTLAPAARMALDAWRADLLDLPWPRGYDEVPALLKSRLHLRRAGLWAGRANQLARLGRPARLAAQRALAELATVDKGEFGEDDRLEYAEAAIRVGAVRWAAAPATGLVDASRHGLRVVTLAGSAPGQTCVRLLAAEGMAPTPAGTAREPAARGDGGPRLLAERCTGGTVWLGSVAVRPSGDALTLAVQPLEGGTELWLFRADKGGRPEQGHEGATALATAWRVDTLPPAPAAPGLGYVEFAGWAPGAQPRLLVVRASRTQGRFSHRFEVLALDTLEPVQQASTPQQLAAFGQWSEAKRRQHAVATR